MKRGSGLGWLAVLAFALCGTGVKAQNLGLGAGSRPSSDSAQAGRSGWKDESAPPRGAQMTKRLGLSARRNGVFDPKVFEARGRELQGQFYEIGGPVDTKSRRTAKAFADTDNATIQRKGGTQWMIWAGVAGLAGASAGAVGYLYMTKAHPTAPPPISIIVTDKP
jgi:hypothetical protein